MPVGGNMRKMLKMAFVVFLLGGMLYASALKDYRPSWQLSWEEFSRKDDVRIGLALGGGAVLGAAHIGVLKAIDELNIQIDFITGTSIGAFVAGFYAFDKSWEEILDIAEDLSWLDLSGLSFSRMGLLSNKKMGELIDQHIGKQNLEDANIPIAMIAADITSMEKIVLTKGSVAKAAMASACVPGVFSPVEIDNRLLVDGGLVESVPISPLKDMGADMIIAVDLNAKQNKEPPNNIIEVLLRTFQITSYTATNYQLRDADILISPDLSAFNVVDIDQYQALFEAGYKTAMQVLGDAF
jgi:NTE family protein